MGGKARQGEEAGKSRICAKKQYVPQTIGLSLEEGKNERVKKALLYGTGSCTTYLVTSVMEKNLKKNTCVCVYTKLNDFAVYLQQIHYKSTALQKVKKKKKKRFAAGANAQLECPTKNSGYFLAVCNKTIMDKTMS